MACKFGRNMQQAVVFVREGKKKGGVDELGSEKQRKEERKKTE